MFNLKIKNWNIEGETGYHPLTTCYADLSIAERFGTQAVVDTYKCLSTQWKDDIKYITELYMALNWKIWEHYENNIQLAKLYNNLWRQTYDKIVKNKNFNDNDLKYFYHTTD